MTMSVCQEFQNHPDRVKQVRQELGSLPLDKVTNFLKAIAEDNRTKIVTALSRYPELCVCDIANILGISQANASSHLRKLYKVGVIKDRKEGKQVYYSLEDEHVQAIINKTIEHMEED